MKYSLLSSEIFVFWWKGDPLWILLDELLLETIFPYDLLYLENFSRNAMDSDKVNNGFSPSVFYWLACWVVYVFSRLYLFFSEFTFVIQNKGPLLKTSQNCSESLVVFSVTAATNKCTICTAKAMLSQFSFLFWNVLMLVTYRMEAGLVSKSLTSIQECIKGNLRKAYSCIWFWGHVGLRWLKSFTVPDSATMWTVVIKPLISSCLLLRLALL